MNWSTSDFPVLQYLPEFAQIHVHWVSDAIQPSQALLPPSPPVLNLSQHQGLFQWVGSSHQVVKVEGVRKHQNLSVTNSFKCWIKCNKHPLEYVAELLRKLEKSPKAQRKDGPETTRWVLRLLLQQLGWGYLSLRRRLGHLGFDGHKRTVESAESRNWEPCQWLQPWRAMSWGRGEIENIHPAVGGDEEAYRFQSKALGGDKKRQSWSILKEAYLPRESGAPECVFYFCDLQLFKQS